VATAFRILLQSRRDEVPRGDVEQALQALEEAVLRTINVFGTQELANIMHAMAKAHYTPTNPLVLGPLEQHTEALADTFNTQDVANTIWAYATMGREPGAGLMRVLEGRAEALAGTFKAQGVANTLWAYATMGRTAATAPRRLFWCSVTLESTACTQLSCRSSYQSQICRTLAWSRHALESANLQEQLAPCCGRCNCPDGLVSP